MTVAQQDSCESAVRGGDSSRGGGADAAVTELEPAAVAERFRWARRQGHPFWLWPDVTVADWRASLVALERVATALLRGERATLQARPGPAALGLAAYTSGVGPWLGWHLEDGLLAGDVPTAGILAAHLDHARRRAARMATALQDVLGALGGAGVDATLLKGVHTASAYFVEPGLRPMADMDVLVHADAIAASERALAAAGYVEEQSARLARPYRAEWRLRGAPDLPRSLTLTHADDPFAFDLHGTLDIDFFGVHTVPFGHPHWSALAAASFGSATATVLRQPLLAAHLAVHASHGLHGLTLIRLVELALVLRADMRLPADWNELGDLLRVLRAERFAFPAIALTDRLVPGLVPAPFLGGLRAAAPQRLRAVIDELRPATAQRIDGLALDERFMWAATPGEHLRRLGNMLLPTGAGGPVRRLGRIYAERAFRIARGRVSLRGGRDG